jgi:MFS transporter, OPA family, solute carrier family 37 (glycerol-3-phosphate transporter), member 3
MFCYKTRGAGQATVLLLTFFSYAAFHVTRKSFSYAKVNLAYPRCNGTVAADGNTCCFSGSSSSSSSFGYHNASVACDAAHPLLLACALDNSTAAAAAGLRLCDAYFGPLSVTTSYLGILDTLFLFCYAVGLFVAGFVEDRMNLRYALTAGMLLSGVCVLAFTWMAHAGVRAFWPYAVAWSLNGLIQASGWPANVAIMGQWFGRCACPCGAGRVERGAVLGAWSGNASFGNIVSYFVFTFGLNFSTLDGYRVGQDGNWIAGMFFSGVVIIVSAFSVLLFVRLPGQVGFAVSTGAEDDDDDDDKEEEQDMHDKAEALLLNGGGSGSGDAHHHHALSFCGALRLPGVVPYSLAYMCLKLANYAMFFWLPFYLSHSVDAKGSAASSDLISNTFDYGQIAGGFFAGFLSDKLRTRSPVVVCMLLLSSGAFVPFMLSPSLQTVRILVPVVGFLLGGPANMISATVSADLGSIGNGAAMATVTGIVDGTGSFGAAVGQYLVVVLAGCEGSSCHWGPVFVMLIACTVFAAAFLWRVFLREVRVLGCSRVASIGDRGAPSARPSSEPAAQQQFSGHQRRWSIMDG